MVNEEKPCKVLAIDLGLRTGFAYYAGGELVSYRSTHFQNIAALKKSVWSILKEYDEVELVVVEGDPHLGEIWGRAAEKQSIEFRCISAHTWRVDLLTDAERQSGVKAKEAADIHAKRIIAASNARNPTGALMSDVAEAILIGYWAAGLGSL